MFPQVNESVDVCLRQFGEAFSAAAKPCWLDCCSARTVRAESIQAIRVEPELKVGSTIGPPLGGESGGWRACQLLHGDNFAFERFDDFESRARVCIACAQVIDNGVDSINELEH